MKRLDPAYIAKQLDIRDAIHYRAYDEKEANNKARYKIYDRKGDQMRDAIIKDMTECFNEYPVDEVLEILTRFGQAPNLVYDDNGRWAVSGDGYQPVVTGDELIAGGLTVFAETHMWKKTIREALLHYMTYEEPPPSKEDSEWMDQVLKDNGFDPKGDT